MMYDELLTADALSIAMQAETDSITLLGILSNRVPNKTLRYQYEALMDEERRHLHSLRAFSEILPDMTTATGTAESRSRIGTRYPSEAVMRTLDLASLLEVFASNESDVVDLYEDISSRIDDESARKLFRELADAECYHRAKAMADLDLLLRKPDFL